MASAALPSVSSTKETTNYARLCRLLVDVGLQALRDTFDVIHPPAGLHGVLVRHPEHATLQSLKKKKILNPTQWGKLYPTVASSVSSATFDITLLMVLLRNICGLHPPATGWDSLPPPADMSTEANIARVKYYRNTVYGHASQASVDDATFNAFWQDISTALVALGGVSYGAAINKLKNECMDPDVEEHYRELLKQWKKDEDSIKDKLEEIEEVLNQLKKEKGDIKDKLGDVEGNIKDKLDQVENKVGLVAENIKGKLDKMGNQVKTVSEKLDSLTGSFEDEENTKDKLEEIKIEIGNLKENLDTLMNRPPAKKEPGMEGVFDPTEIIDGIRELYKSCEGWLAPFPWCEEFHFHLDDIYTRLKVVRRKKTRGAASIDTVNMSGIFKPHEECAKPRTVLIEGKPGIGKTTYCKKLVYDWATEKAEAEDCFPRFEAVLLLRCRDVNSDLWEAIDDQLLSRDVKEDARERFFDFVRHNQSNVLLILDGLDEVPASKLPMFSEIIQGRLLPKCRLVATARHEAGIKVRIHCDTLLEIEGFTLEDVENFIIKYFNNMEDLAQKLADQLTDNENLLEMAANPLNTALLCLFCEEFQGVFPENRTKLYMEIIQCVLRRYMQKKGLSYDNEDLIEVYITQLKHLGWIALNGLREGNIDFEESELGSHAADLPGFGFLSVQPGGSKLRPRRQYSFLHKSFQEFFAAVYLCCQLLDKEISADSLAADKRYLHELKEVLKFTCGLLAARCEETTTALAKSITTLVNHEDDVKLFSVVLECINECKKDKCGFHITLARVSGSLLKLKGNSSLTDLKETFSDIDEAGAAALAESLKENSIVTEFNWPVNNFGDAGATGLAEALSQNSSLTKLYLYGNHIGYAGATSLAEALRQNSSLKRLNLSRNSIGDAGATVLAVALRQNSSVTELNLSRNNISDDGATGLADALRKNSSLTELNLSVNNIGDAGATGLAETLRQNSSLTELNLANSNIGDTGATGLAAALRQNSSLTKLNLSSNNINGDAATSLAEALRQNLSLTKLNMSRNNIDGDAATSLAEALRQNSSLTKLNLSYNHIGDAGAAGLAEALRENSSVTKLNLSYNFIHYDGAAGLAEALRENSIVTELNLSGNHIGYAGAAGLAEALRQNSSLTKLDLSSNSIDIAGAVGLAETLRRNSSLTKLYLSSNDIGNAGAAGLAEALRENSSVTELNLSFNYIGDDGATVLAETLRQNSSLTLLDLFGNNVGLAGGACLAEALRQNSSLTKLDLCGNNIGYAGAAGLAAALRENSSVVELNLYGNNIGNAGAAGLAEALRENSSVAELNLSDNNIGDDGATCLAEALRQNSSLTSLHLSRNNIGDAGAAALSEVLRGNSNVELTLYFNNVSEAVFSELERNC